ncbi:hypothetical protein BDZ97DRAFT_1687152 [Flammula alnicola]|nr:hypothetical protein BDZ97DRAFT_1687152 [Flammula alnicola]
MLLILSLLYLVRGGIHAAPTAPLFPRDTSTLNLSPPACTCPDQRTIWDILWSCLSTLFACSWVAVHPNIPAPGAKWWHVALTRLELMVWAIIAPEMMILWAMRQWLGARELEKTYKAPRSGCQTDKGWTKTHGYFLQMGGFMLFEGNTRKGVLSHRTLEALLEEDKIKFPNITEEEIQDRSKGDALSKTLVIGQTTWFIAQCISRKAQGLVTTELELVTLGFAVLNAFMYYFWWNKPLGVRTSVPVYLLDTPTDNIDSTDIYVDHENDRSRTTAETFKTIGFGRHHVNMIRLSPGKLKGADKLTLIVDELIILSNIFYLSPVNAVVAIFRKLADMPAPGGDSSFIATGAMQVHTFYAMSTTDRKDSSLNGCVSLIGMVFGAIHCAGWNFLFPSRAELILWRISSFVITAVPLSMAWGIALYLVRMLHPTSHFVEEVRRGLMELMDFNTASTSSVLVSGIPLYVLARFTLLAEAFIALRNLSPSALAVVRWTSFLPHI